MNGGRVSHISAVKCSCVKNPGELTFEIGYSSDLHSKYTAFFVQFHAPHHTVLPGDEVFHGSATLVHARPERHGPGKDYIHQLCGRGYSVGLAHSKDGGFLVDEE